MFLRKRAGGVLEAESAHLIRRRAYESKAGFFASFSEFRIFAEEAVAGMDRLRACIRGGGEDAVNFQVALAHGGRAEQDRLVGDGNVVFEPRLAFQVKLGMNGRMLARKG